MIMTFDELDQELQVHAKMLRPTDFNAWNYLVTQGTIMSCVRFGGGYRPPERLVKNMSRRTDNV